MSEIENVGTAKEKRRGVVAIVRVRVMRRNTYGEPKRRRKNRKKIIT